MTLAGLLERATLRRPRAEAVVDGATRLTYAELDARTAALSRRLGGLGVGRGDRVLLVLKNRVEHVLAYWALQRYISRRLPQRRVRRGQCPFCGYPAGAGPRVRLSVLAVLLACSRCARG